MEGGIEGAHPWGASIIPPPAHLGGLGGIPPSATAIPVTHCRGEPGALLFASADDPLPELEGHVGDVAGAGDGGGMERCQVRGRDGGPARSLEIDGHQFFFHQHNKGTGVLKAWGGGRWLLLAETPPPHHHHPLRRATPAERTSLSCLGALHGEEVDDTGGEVERGQSLALQHADTVSVAIACPRHPPVEDDEGVPGWDEAACIRSQTPQSIFPGSLGPPPSRPSPPPPSCPPHQSSPPMPRGRTPTRRSAREFC